MKDQAAGSRVAVLGSSSLMGKELLAILEGRDFPVAHLVKLEDETDEPELPILDLAPPLASPPGGDPPSDFDFAFIASRTSHASSFLEALAPPPASDTASSGRTTVIDLAGNQTGGIKSVLRIPFLEPAGSLTAGHPHGGLRHFASPHSATIVLSTLLLRFGARFPAARAVAEIFTSASESGPRAIEELQKQTVNLLGFQQLPKEVYGAQIAFNLLPRLAGTAKPGAENLEARIRAELSACLGGRVPVPALRLLHVPAFYSLALSLYLETDGPFSATGAVQALSGKPVRIRRASEHAPSPVEVAGSDDILLDAILPDPARAGGIWIWAVADNLRLAAANAVQIAEKVRETRGF